MNGAPTPDVDVPGRALRTSLAEGVVYGTWVKHPVGDHVELFARAGFDCLVIDLEHGLIAPEQLPDLVRAAEAGGCEALVRLDRFERALATKVMDSGAAGIMVPDVRSRSAAEDAVAAARYAPAGVRGASPTNRGARYGMIPFAAYREAADEAALVIAQVEGPEGVAALDEILTVDGLDGVFIGPYDLSVHLGVPADVGHERVSAAMRDICERALEREVRVGTWLPQPEAAAEWVGLGVGLVTVSNSVQVLTDAVTSLVSRLPGRTAGASHP